MNRLLLNFVVVPEAFCGVSDDFVVPESCSIVV
jgi:hypothetical protein